ncbi:IclR family transcriptional regulator [Fluviibacterium sp. DFM31]|uniref:IclR family transcriptional regulator n=1 Tax=Meridianimarinicoccus marinus TaxID=3231483 RepID=A0ABV3L601_9RHOB
MDETDKDGTIPTNLRLLLVLEAMAEAGVPVTPTEVNRQLGLPKPTIHRLFNTLEDEGFIQREFNGRGYAPAPRLRQLSAGVLSSLRMRTARVAILKRLAAEIHETCVLAVPDRDAMIGLEQAETRHALRIQLPLRARMPLYCTASGKMFLSTFDDTPLETYITTTALADRTPRTITDPDRLAEAVRRTRDRGFGIDNGEFLNGMVSLAVPVLDGSGRLLSTLSFHAPEQRLALKDAVHLVPQLHATAARLGALIDEA